MRRTTRVLVVASMLLAPAAVASQATYYPGPGGDWERRAPAQVGIDGRQLEEAIAFAKANESKGPRDLESAHYQSFGREPFGEGIGPFKTRGDATGVILRRGYIVAEWGDPHRVDMTFSVTKSFLSTTVGLALDRGLIRSVQDRVADYMATVLLVMRDDNESRVPATNGESAVLPIDTPHIHKITRAHQHRPTK